MRFLLESLTEVGAGLVALTLLVLAWIGAMTCLALPDFMEREDRRVREAEAQMCEVRP